MHWLWATHVTSLHAVLCHCLRRIFECKYSKLIVSLGIGTISQKNYTFSFTPIGIVSSDPCQYTGLNSQGEVHSWPWMSALKLLEIPLINENIQNGRKWRTDHENNYIYCFTCVCKSSKKRCTYFFTKHCIPSS